MNRMRKSVTILASSNLRYWQRMKSKFSTQLIPAWDLSGTVATDVGGNAHNGAYVGTVTLGQPGVGDGNTSIKLEGTGCINLYSPEFASAWNGNEFTLNLFFKPLNAAFWTNGLAERFLTIRGLAGNDDIQFYHGANNRVGVTGSIGGVAFALFLSAMSTTNWIAMTLTNSYSAHEMKLYINGKQVGTDGTQTPATVTNLGEWTHAPLSDRCVIGAISTALGNPASGWFAYGGDAPYALTAAEVQSIVYEWGTPVNPPAGVTTPYVAQTFPEMTADDFTVIAIPDSQYYPARYPQTGFAQMDWINGQRTLLNTQMVLHEGDSVDAIANAAQVTDATAIVARLGSTYPSLIAPGNHDMVNFNDPTNRDMTVWNTIAPSTRYTSAAWFSGGFYEAGKSENVYTLLTIGAKTYLFMSLEYGPRADVMTWANGIIAANVDKQTIIVTHSDVDGNSNLTAEGTALWNGCGKLHPNLIMVICGHTGGPVLQGYLQTVGDNANTVHHIEADLQDELFGGSGYLRVMRFRPSENKVYIETYSPTLNQWKTAAAHQFVIDTTL
jgi:hypothetical protein